MQTTYEERFSLESMQAKSAPEIQGPSLSETSLISMNPAHFSARPAWHLVIATLYSTCVYPNAQESDGSRSVLKEKVTPSSPRCARNHPKSPVPGLTLYLCELLETTVEVDKLRLKPCRHCCLAGLLLTPPPPPPPPPHLPSMY